MYPNQAENNIENKNINEQPLDNNYNGPTKRPQKSRIIAIAIWFVFCALLFLVLNLSYHFLVSPPGDFPVDEPIEIVLGTSVVDIAKQLKEANIVRSELLLYAVLVVYYQPNDVKASTYIFSTPLSVHEVAQALTEGNYSYDLVRFTHKEGDSVRAMAPNIASTFPHITTEEFITFATPFEGELFPETYFVPKGILLPKLVALMREHYASTTEVQLSMNNDNTLTTKEVIILASILEREANSPESMQQVANILLRRLSIDMPLQVDATMEYVMDKPLSELLPEDLLVDSPYNTYTRFGLPPTPIGNPGIDAINAVLNATTATPYLFYITGNDGKFYYAKDFDKHRLNISRHLR